MKKLFLALALGITVLLSCEKSRCYECNTVIRTFYQYGYRTIRDGDTSLVHLIERDTTKIFCDTMMNLEAEFQEEQYPEIDSTRTYTTVRTQCKEIR